jgi:hypothetical protein
LTNQKTLTNSAKTLLSELGVHSRDIFSCEYTFHHEDRDIAHAISFLSGDFFRLNPKYRQFRINQNGFEFILKNKESIPKSFKNTLAVVERIISDRDSHDGKLMAQESSELKKK